MVSTVSMVGTASMVRMGSMVRIVSMVRMVGIVGNMNIGMTRSPRTMYGESRQAIGRSHISTG